jgi:hypothetical protein
MPASKPAPPQIDLTQDWPEYSAQNHGQRLEILRFSFAASVAVLVLMGGFLVVTNRRQQPISAMASRRGWRPSLIGIWSRRFGVGRRGSLRAEVARTPNKNKVSSCRHFWSCVRDCPPHQRGWSGVNRRRCLAAGFCEAVGVAPRIQPRAGSGGPEALIRGARRWGFASCCTSGWWAAWVNRECG